MSRGSATVTSHTRRFVRTSPLFLVAWAFAALLDAPAQTTVPLALHGFVFTMVFGKAYALLPAYFDTTLTPTWPPALQFPVTVVGAVAIAAAGLPVVPAWVGTIGAVCWTAGAVLFVAAMAWTIRDNLTGAATGTSDVNAARRRLDRLSNAVVPVVFAYVLTGGYVLVATRTDLPTGGLSPAGGTHLLAAGGAALLVFGVGFRLFPRFLAATPPPGIPVVVLGSGAVAPAVLAASLYGGTLFRVAAALEAIAVTGFGVAYAVLFSRSDRDRIGLYGPFLGAALGIGGVGLGLLFAFGEGTAGLVVVHRRLNLVGFLGVTIMGAAYQFYPPAVGTFPWAGDTVAGVSLGAVFAGLLVQGLATVAGFDLVFVAGEAIVLGGVGSYAYLVVGLLHQRRT